MDLRMTANNSTRITTACCTSGGDHHEACQPIEAVISVQKEASDTSNQHERERGRERVMRDAQVDEMQPQAVRFEAAVVEIEDGGGTGTRVALGVDSHSETIISQQVAHKPASSSITSEAIMDTAPEQQHNISLLQSDPSPQQASQAQTSLQQALAQKDAELQHLQRTHDEYIKSSCEYERELEHALELCERKSAALEHHVHTLELAKEFTLAKQLELHAQVDATSKHEQLLLAELEEMKWKVQRLEQANDELETAARISQASIADLEHKSETLLEQNVFLQHEKEEVVRQLAAITVAEVHPTPPPSTSSSGSSSIFSRSPSNNLLSNSEKSPAQASQQQQQVQQVQQHLRGKNKSKGRYPEVVESCIHITCRKCRPSHHHSHHNRHHTRHQRNSSSHAPIASSCDRTTSAEGLKKKALLGVFERLRLRVRALFDCSDGKLAVAETPSPPTAPKAPVAPMT